VATLSPSVPTPEGDGAADDAGSFARSRGRAARVALFVAGIVLAIALFRLVGWPAIAANLERIGPLRFGFLVALYSLTQAAFAFGWWLVIDPLPPAREMPHLFAVYLAGDSWNYAAPGGVAGEPVKARLLGKHTGTGSALASLTLHKHADLVAQWAFVSAGVAYAAWRFPIGTAARVAAAAGAAGLGALLLLLTWAMRRGTYAPIVRRLARWKFLARRLERYQHSAEAIDQRILAFSAHRGRYVASVAVCFAGWCGGMLETWLILRFLAPGAGWGTALAVESLSMALNNMLLFVPGRVGSAEGVRTAVFVLLGLPAAQGLAYGLVRRGRELLWTIPGFAALVRWHALDLARPQAARRPTQAPGASR